MAKGQPPTIAYSEDERKAALELAAATNVKSAAEHLGISERAIWRWTNKYPQLWSDLRAGDPEVQKRGIANRLQDLADRYTSAEHDALDRVPELISKADPKETAALIKAMGSSRQAATLGARQVLGEPEVHEHNINFPQIEAAMERLLEGADSPQSALPVANEAEAVES